MIDLAKGGYGIMKSLPVCGMAIVLATAAVALGAPGDLDPTFGSGGVVLTSISPGTDLGRALVQQPDGRFVVAGASSNGTDRDFVVVRYNFDGTVDASFGSGGSVVTPIGTADDRAAALVLQDDGKLVAAGFSSLGFTLVRYQPDGSLDTGFGSGGIVTTTPVSGTAGASAMVRQPDGKLVVVGASPPGIELVRYNPDGTLDSSFDGDGVVTTDVTLGDESPEAMVIQPDGRIVVGGGYTPPGGYKDYFLARYNADGSLDATFDGDGLVTTVVGGSFDELLALTLQPDGRLIAGGRFQAIGSGNENFLLVRYNTDGSLDASFSGGIVTQDLGSISDLIREIVVQPDGKILAIGRVLSPGAIAIVRYRADGTVDTTFGAAGTVLTDIGSGGDYAYAAVLLSDGRLVTAGESIVGGGQTDINLVRYLLTRGCPPVAQSGCRSALKSVFQIKTNVDASRNKLLWKWIKGQATSAAEFADPRTGAEYALCLYGGASQALIGSGEIVVPSGSAAWAILHDKGWRYKDAVAAIDGVQQILLKASTQPKAKAKLKGAGAALPVPALPLVPAELPLLVQLVNSDSGVCWQSTFDSSSIARNDARFLKGKAQ